MPFGLLFTTMMLLPMGYALYQSFFKVQRSGLGLQPAAKVFAGLGNYVTAVRDSAFMSSLLRVFMLGVVQVPVMLGFGGYLTLDSDVCCVGDFDACTFVEHGRALSRWEPKRHHDWWENASEIVGVPYDARTHGLSVTPNILHGDLCRQALAHFRRGTFDPMTSLGLWVLRKVGGGIAWTEYSLYTGVAELKGNLFDYHVHWDPSYFHDTQLFSETSCVWGADDFERLVQLPNGNDPGGKFIIVQSHARIPLERVRDYCLSFAG